MLSINLIFDMFRHVCFPSVGSCSDMYVLVQLDVGTPTYFYVSPVDGLREFLRIEGRTFGASNPLDVAMGF